MRLLKDTRSLMEKIVEQLRKMLEETQKLEEQIPSLEVRQNALTVNSVFKTFSLRRTNLH